MWKTLKRKLFVKCVHPWAYRKTELIAYNKVLNALKTSSIFSHILKGKFSISFEFCVELAHPNKL